MRAPHAQGGTTNYAHAQLPLFQPMPESQPVLPCLLRRLLQQVRVLSCKASCHRTHASILSCPAGPVWQ